MEGTMSEEEFMQYYERFNDAIFRHIYYRVFDRELAVDLTQATFMKTWEYASAGKSIDNVKTFLYRVATNLIIDNFRRKKSESLDYLQQLGFDIGIDGREAQVAKLDAEKILHKLKELDEASQQLLVMRYIDGLGPKEIAAILKISENKVSVNLHRAILKIRKIDS